MTRTIPESARAIVYTRVSTRKQAAPEKASLDDQLRRCRALAAELGHPDPYVWEDPGKKGADRRRLDELVAWCEAHGRSDGVVVVWSPDRFARIGADVVGHYTTRLKDAGWDLQYVDMRRTGNKTADGIMGAARAELAAEENRIKHERSLMGARKIAGDGKWNGGPPPLGYAIGDDKRLVPGDPADVKKVRRAFAMYARGATLDAVAREAGRVPSGARALLANPAYVGAIEWGRRTGSQAHGTREDAHPAIVDRATWDAVQARLQSPNPRYAHGAKRPAPKGALPYILSKVVRCTCRADQFLVGGGGIPKRATEAQRLRWRGYQCKACRGRVGQAALEAAVYGAIAKAIREADASGDLKRRMDKWVAARIAASSAGGVERERADLLRRKARLIRTAEETDDRDVSARIREVGARLRELDQSRRAAPDPRAVKAEGARALAEIRAAVAPKTVTPEAANVSLGRLRPLITAVIWDRETRTVEVNLVPWRGTEVGIVARPSGHSDSSAPWRVRA
jgi:DNA invertase Pin-like site-specific DNA recombinase